jgi:predicted solute-binding protein
VVVDPASETSVNLLHCLLGERGVTARFVLKGKIGAERGRLLIGDQAIRFRQQSGGRHQFLDLGAEWKERMQRPFVYGLWLIHPGYAEKRQVAEALRSIGKHNRENLDTLIEAQPKKDRVFCRFYYRECLRFTFGKSEKDGFKRFGKLCARRKLLPAVPSAPRLV